MAEAVLIDGTAVAARLRQRIAEAAAALHAQYGWQAGLAAVLVGEDPASQIYVRSKRRACEAAGLASFEHRLPPEADLATVLRLIERLNADPGVDGILVQLPLPAHLDSRQIIAVIDPTKDVDGFHPVNVGRLWAGEASLVPCTPQGVLRLLREVHHGGLAGLGAVVLGRSSIVGRPVAALLLGADCTVTIAHSKSDDLPGLCRAADILVAAVGRPQLVKRDWVKPGATVIDVGINRVAGAPAKSQLLGDVDLPEVRQIAGAITPVPGGVGPMTIACLLLNTIIAACCRRAIPLPPSLNAQV